MMNELLTNPAFWGLLGTITGAILQPLGTMFREHLQNEKKTKKDVTYLAVIVSAQLEKFAVDCVDVAADDGLCQGQPDKNGYRTPQTSAPDFEIDKLNVEWKSLPNDLMNAVFEIPYQVYVSDRSIGNAFEYDDPPDYWQGFETRQYKYAELGLEAIAIAEKLRKSADLPARKPPAWDIKQFLTEKIAEIDNDRLEREKRWEAKNKLNPPPPPPTVNAQSS